MGAIRIQFWDGKGEKSGVGGGEQSMTISLFTRCDTNMYVVILGVWLKLCLTGTLAYNYTQY